MAVAEKVKSIIAEQLGVKPEEVTPEASFIDDLGADSLDTVELVMALEEEFGIEIPGGKLKAPSPVVLENFLITALGSLCPQHTREPVIIGGNGHGPVSQLFVILLK